MYNGRRFQSKKEISDYVALSSGSRGETMHIAAFHLSTRMLAGAVVLICLSAGAESAFGQCVAQVTPKLTFEDFEKRVVKDLNSETFTLFITGRPPAPKPAPSSDYYWSQIHDAMENQIKSYYNGTYEPRDVVCFALSDQEYTNADTAVTYGGKKIVLAKVKHPDKPRLDGPLGPNAELLDKVYTAALNYVINQSEHTYCNAPQIIVPCTKNRIFLQTLREAMNGADSNFIREKQDYSEYEVTNASAFDSASLTAFYDQVAALSYFNAPFGGFHAIPFKNASGQTLVVNATFFDPIDPTNPLSDRVPTLSLLDFVDGNLIGVLSKEFYSPLFEALVRDETWTARAVLTKSLHKRTTLGASGETALGDGISDLFCREIVNDEVRYSDLLTKTKREFLYNHATFFCTFFEEGSSTHALDFTQFLKTQDTLALSVTVDALEQINNDISTRLTTLSQLTIEQKNLLNAIKRYVGNQSYEAKQQRIQAEIAEAERREEASGLGSLLQNIPGALAALADLPGLGVGTYALVSHLANLPDSDPIAYVSVHEEELNKSKEQIRKGGAAVGTLIGAVDGLINQKNNSEQAAADLARLRQALAAVQKEYDEFQAGIAAEADANKGQYLTTMRELIDLSEQRRRIYLGAQMSLYNAVVKETLSAKREHASPLAVKACKGLVNDFIAAPSEVTRGQVITICSNYSGRNLIEIRECLRKSKPAQDYSLVFAGSTGFVIEENRRTSCLAVASPTANVSSSVH